jgi:hypothetical protein
LEKATTAMGAGELLTLDRKVSLTAWPNCDIRLNLIRGEITKNMEKLDDCRRNGHAAIIGKAVHCELELAGINDLYLETLCSF